MNGNAMRYYQILINLLSNALRFTVKGKICIYVKYDFDRGELCTYIKDNGDGFIPGEQEVFFNPEN